MDGERAAEGGRMPTVEQQVAQGAEAEAGETRRARRGRRLHPAVVVVGAVLVIVLAVGALYAYRT